MPLITFEGIDGSGKSTQISLLTAWLNEQRGLDVEVFREPGGTILSEEIRSLLLDNKQNINPVSEILLFSAARAQLISEKVQPLLEKDKWVILDRFYDSSTAYQGYGRNVLTVKEINVLNQIAVNGLTPDLTFFLDINWAISSQRRQGTKADRMEEAGGDFFKRVVNGYREIATKESRVVRIDGNQEVSIIFETIKSTVLNRFNLP